MFISSFCSKLLIRVLVSFPSLFVPFISLFIAFTWAFFFWSPSTCYIVRGRAIGIHQGGATYLAVLWCGVWGRVREGTMRPTQLSASFQSPQLLSTSKLGPSGADAQMRGFVYFLGPCGSLQQTHLWSGKFLLPTQPPQVFSVRGFEALFPRTGTLGCAVCLAPQLFLPVYLHTNAGLPAPPAATFPAPVLQPPPCHESSPSGCPAPPLLPARVSVSSLTFWCRTSIHFYFLAVLVIFFVFKFPFVLFLVVHCEEAQCVYLRLHLGRKPAFSFLL